MQQCSFVTQTSALDVSDRTSASDSKVTAQPAQTFKD